MPLISRLDLFTIENINGFEMHFSYALSQPPIFDFNVFSSMWELDINNSPEVYRATEYDDLCLQFYL